MTLEPWKGSGLLPKAVQLRKQQPGLKPRLGPLGLGPLPLSALSLRFSGALERRERPNAQMVDHNAPALGLE